MADPALASVARGAPVGVVDTAAGEVVAIRTDGTEVPLEAGDPIFEGDRLVTSEGGVVEVVFADESQFSLGENGAMTIDEMVYDPGSGTGAASVSVGEGVFVFVSGMISKTSPDAMLVKTPLMTVGVRGTKVVGEAGPEPTDNKITLLQEDDGATGEIVVITDGGVEVLNKPFQTVQIAEANQPPPSPKILSHPEIDNLYGRQFDARDGHIRTDAVNDNAPEATERAPEDADDTALLDEDIVELAAFTTEAGAGHDNSDTGMPPNDASPDAEPPTADGAAKNMAKLAAWLERRDVDVDSLDVDDWQSLVAAAPPGLAQKFKVWLDDTARRIEQANADEAQGDTAIDVAPSGQGVLPSGIHADALKDDKDKADDEALVNKDQGNAQGQGQKAQGDEGDGDDAGLGANGNSNVHGQDQQALANDDQDGDGELGNNGQGNTHGQGQGRGSGDTPATRNVLGTTGDDHIVTGDDKDVIYAGDGDDTVSAGGDDDVIIGGSGAGNDTYDGGDGNDTIRYESAEDGITVDLARGRASGPDIDSDRLSGIENVVGGAGDDSLRGTKGANAMDGGAGNDTITGTGNADTFYGNKGDDALFGGDGDDVFEIAGGGHGTDAIDGGAGDDLLLGSRGNDVFNVTDDLANLTSVETIDGAGGWDRIVASAGDDALDFSAEDAPDLVSIERIDGGAGNDTITGTGNTDTLYGNKGDDVLAGGAGDDVLLGGRGDDVFLFDAGSGDDIIGDFAAGDRLVFLGDDLEISDVSFEQVGSDVKVTVLGDDGRSVTIENANAADLNGYSVSESEGGGVGVTVGSDPTS